MCRLRRGRGGRFVLTWGWRGYLSQCPSSDTESFFPPSPCSGCRGSWRWHHGGLPTENTFSLKVKRWHATVGDSVTCRLEGPFISTLVISCFFGILTLSEVEQKAPEAADTQRDASNLSWVEFHCPPAGPETLWVSSRCRTVAAQDCRGWRMWVCVCQNCLPSACTCTCVQCACCFLWKQHDKGSGQKGVRWGWGGRSQTSWAHLQQKLLDLHAEGIREIISWCYGMFFMCNWEATWWELKPKVFHSERFKLPNWLQHPHDNVLAIRLVTYAARWGKL